MFLSKAIEGFLLDRDGESDDDLSPTTLKLYRGCLRTLTQYIGDKPLLSVTGDDLARFMVWLERDYRTHKGQKVSGYYRDNHWKAIRSLFNWANRVLKNPRPDLALPRPVYAEEEIIPYTEDEVRKILAACEMTILSKTRGRKPFKMRRPTVVRDKAIVLLLLETGIRLGELHRLKIENVNLESGEIRIKPYRTGKKSRARTIPIEKGCKRALWLYSVANNADRLKEEPFFPLAWHSYQSLFLRLEERTGIEGVHAHRFRHTFAIQYLRNGGDIFTLQRILGHATLEMCRRYLAIAQSDIRDAHRRASPVDRWRL
jgi:integrase/recombinase XerD